MYLLSIEHFAHSWSWRKVYIKALLEISHIKGIVSSRKEWISLSGLMLCDDIHRACCILEV